MTIEVKELIQAAYQRPDRKSCFFTGNANPEVAELVGIDQWDWTPQKSINIEPYYWNTHTIALAFGCEKVFTSDGKEWVKPLITDPSEIKQITIPVVQAGRTGEILQRIQALLSEYPEHTLVRAPDIQSPLGVAELIMGEQVYFALMTHRNELHDLLEKIMIFTVRYIQAIRDLAGDRLNASCHPQVWCDHEGYYISDDANSMVSPEMHLEFSVDYINRMTKELGPVIYHTCTWTDLYRENIGKIENKKLVNWSIGTSMDPAELIRENSGHVVIAPHIGRGVHMESGITRLGLNLNSETDVVRYFIDSMQEDTVLYFHLHESLWENPRVISEIYALFGEYGYLPPDAHEQKH